MSEITIVMAAYNGEAYIEEQINSILESSFQDFSLHVYDDGSTDGTRAILERLAKKHPQKLCFFANSRNKGVIKNFMEGALAAESPYIMFSDQDDVWLKEKLEWSLKKIKEREQEVGKDTPVVVFTDARVVDENLGSIAPSFHRFSHLNTEKIDLAHLLMENKLIGCTMLFNQSMQKRLTPIPDRLRLHDWWIGLIGAAFGEVSYLPRATLLYRQHESNVVGSKSFAAYVGQRLSSPGRQRQALKRTVEQAEDFLAVFGEALPEEKRRIVEAFASLESVGFLKRRYLLIKYGFWKTGLLRNIGVFLIL